MLNFPDASCVSETSRDDGRSDEREHVRDAGNGRFSQGNGWNGGNDENETGVGNSGNMWNTGNYSRWGEVVVLPTGPDFSEFQY